MNATDSFRPGLLDGRVVAVAGDGELGRAAADACAQLGARLAAAPEPDAPEPDAPDAAASLDTLVVDAAALFAAASGQDAGPAGPLRAALDGAWDAIRPAATAAMIDRGGGLVVLLAPRPSAADDAGAARDGLENLARALSTEWARHQVRVVAILPGDATPSAQVAALVAFLASPAGDYYSGCRFSLV